MLLRRLLLLQLYVTFGVRQAFFLAWRPPGRFEWQPPGTTSVRALGGLLVCVLNAHYPHLLRRIDVCIVSSFTTDRVRQSVCHVHALCSIENNLSGGRSTCLYVTGESRACFANHVVPTLLVTRDGRMKPYYHCGYHFVCSAPLASLQSARTRRMVMDYRVTAKRQTERRGNWDAHRPAPLKSFVSVFVW